MKRLRVFSVLMVCLALMTLALASCDTVTGQSGANPFLGTWLGYMEGYRYRAVIGDSTWTISVPDYPSAGSASGTYTRDGNTATFLDQDGYAMSTGTISGSTLTIVTGDGTIVFSRQ